MTPALFSGLIRGGTSVRRELRSHMKRNDLQGRASAVNSTLGGFWVLSVVRRFALTDDRWTTRTTLLPLHVGPLLEAVVAPPFRAEALAERFADGMVVLSEWVTPLWSSITSAQIGKISLCN